MPLTITKKAAEQIQAVLKERTEPVAGLRLAMEEACCGLQYSLSLAEGAGEGEHMAESEGIKVFVPAVRSGAFENTVIDFVDTPMGAGFQIRDAPTRGEGSEHGQGHAHRHGHGHGEGGCACGSNGGGGCGCGGAC